MFALGLPMPDYPSLHSLPTSDLSAPLVLPREHPSMDRLFTAKHRRFRRSRQDLPPIQETMESIFHTKLSGRTERRYRRPTSSVPHVDALIQLTVTHLTRYTDALRVQRPTLSDRGRYSLDTLLNTRHLAATNVFLNVLATVNARVEPSATMSRRLSSVVTVEHPLACTQIDCLAKHLADDLQRRAHNGAVAGGPSDLLHGFCRSKVDGGRGSGSNFEHGSSPGHGDGIEPHRLGRAPEVVAAAASLVSTCVCTATPLRSVCMTTQLCSAAARSIFIVSSST
jgi:hypothetical protein